MMLENEVFMGLQLIIGRAPDLHSGGEEIVAPQVHHLKDAYSKLKPESVKFES